MKSLKIREATHAGTWYLEDSTKLQTQIKSFLALAANNAKIPLIKAIIGPHAGFEYSGPTAAFAYQQFQNKENLRVILLGPCHHTYIKGIGLSQLDSYSTPFGNIDLDKETIQQIATDLKKGFVFTNKEIEEEEHSLEMHLPYIYQTFPKCRLVPIMVGATNPEMEMNVAKCLVKYFEDPQTVFVVSSDFCHWGKRFQYTYHKQEDGDIYKSIEKLDHQAIDLIQQHNIKGYYEYLDDTENTICGRHPIGVLLNIINLSKLKLKTQLAKYAQSSQVTSMSDSSVSYAALFTYISE